MWEDLPQEAAGKIKGLGNNDYKALAGAQNIINTLAVALGVPLAGVGSAPVLYSSILCPTGAHREGGEDSCLRNIRIQGAVELT